MGLFTGLPRASAVRSTGAEEPMSGVDWQIDPAVQLQRDEVALSLVKDEMASDPENPYLKREYNDRVNRMNGTSGRTSAISKPQVQQGGNDIMSAMDSYLNAAPQEVATPAPAAENTDGDFVRGVKNYVPQMKEMFNAGETLLGVAAKKAGLDSVGNSMIQGGLEGIKNAKKQQVSKTTDSFTDAYADGGAWTVATDWLPYQIGQTVGNVGEGLLTSAMGALLGSAATPAGSAGGAVTGLLAKTMVKKAVLDEVKKIAAEQGEDVAAAHLKKEVSKAVGSNSALLAAAGYHGVGEVGSTAIEEQQRQGKAIEDLDLARIGGASLAHMGAEFVGDKIELGALFKAAEGDKILKDVVTKTFTTAIKEAPTEVVQTAAERFGANKELLSAEAGKEYLDAAAGGAAGGGITGATGAVANRIVGNVAEQEAQLNQDPLQQDIQQAQERVLAQQQAAVDPNVSPDPAAPVGDQAAVDPSVTVAPNTAVDPTVAPTVAPSANTSQVPPNVVDNTLEQQLSTVPVLDEAGNPVDNSQQTTAVDQTVAPAEIVQNETSGVGNQQQPTVDTVQVAPEPVAPANIQSVSSAMDRVEEASKRFQQLRTKHKNMAKPRKVETEERESLREELARLTHNAIIDAGNENALGKANEVGTAIQEVQNAIFGSSSLYGNDVPAAIAGVREQIAALNQPAVQSSATSTQAEQQQQAAVPAQETTVLNAAEKAKKKQKEKVNVQEAVVEGNNAEATGKKTPEKKQKPKSKVKQDDVQANDAELTDGEKLLAKKKLEELSYDDLETVADTHPDPAIRDKANELADAMFEAEEEAKLDAERKANPTKAKLRAFLAAKKKSGELDVDDHRAALDEFDYMDSDSKLLTNAEIDQVLNYTNFDRDALDDYINEGVKKAQNTSGSGQVQGGSKEDPIAALQRALDADVAASDESGQTRATTVYSDNVPPSLVSLQRLVKSLFGKTVVFVRYEGTNISSGGQIVYDNWHGITLPSRPDLIFINTASTEQSWAAVIGHELLHNLRADNPLLYRDLYNNVISYLDKNSSEYADYIKSYSHNVGVDLDYMEEEMIANAVGDVFQRHEFWIGMMEANPSKFQQIANTIIDMFDKIRSALRGKGFGSSRYFKEIDTVQAVIREALKQYSSENAAQTSARGVRKAQNGTGVTTPSDTSINGLLDGSEKVYPALVNKGKPTVKTLAQALQERATAVLGKPLTDNDSDNNKIAKTLEKEVIRALGTRNNAKHWYGETIQKALSVASLMYPELRTDGNARFAFRYAMAVTSNGQDVGDNSKFAAQVYEEYRKDGRMPDFGTGTEDGAMRLAFNTFNDMVETIGMDNFQKFMHTEFTVSEIKAAGFKPPSGELATETVMGSTIMGAKIGAFYQNLSGNFDALTMDMWWMRMWGRVTGSLFRSADTLTKNIGKFRAAATKETIESIGFDWDQFNADDDVAIAAAVKVHAAFSKGQYKNKTPENNASRNLVNMIKPVEAPRNGSDREWMRRVTKIVSNRTGVSMADLQALVWYPEKELYGKYGVGNKSSAPTDFFIEMSKLAKEKGFSDGEIRNAARRKQSVGNGVQGESGQGNYGFAGKERSRFIKRRVADRVRREFGAGYREEASRTYVRGGAKRLKGARFVSPVSATEFAPKERKAVNLFKTAGLPSEKVYELDNSDNSANAFRSAIILAKVGLGKDGATVHVYDQNEYAGMRLFLNEDGSAGFALKGDDIVSVFAANGAPKGTSVSMVRAAVEQGGRKLDCFDTALPSLYSLNGFKAVSRTKFNDQYAPDGWDYDNYKNFNSGRPDVVFMVFDPSNFDEYSSADGATVDEYDDAVKIQSDEVERLHGTQDTQTPADAGVSVSGVKKAAFKKKGIGNPYAKPDDEITNAFGNEGVEFDHKKWQEKVFGAKEEPKKPVTRAQTLTRQFMEWWGESRLNPYVSNPNGTPRVLYHGTAQDIDTFIAKQAGAIFVTQDPSFADSFASVSAGWMRQNLKGKPQSAENIMPLYVRAEKTFDFSDETAAEAISTRALEFAEEDFKANPEYGNPAVSLRRELKYLPEGSWNAIEHKYVQRAIKEAGYDSFLVYEAGRINMGVYSPNQLKSAVGNNGEFSRSDNSLRKAQMRAPQRQGAQYRLPEETVAEFLQRKIQDKYNRLDKAQKIVAEAGGKLDVRNDAYKAEERSHGIIAYLLDKFRKDVTKPLVEQMSRAGIDMDRVVEYAYAVHAIEANRYIASINPMFPDGGSGMSTADAMQIIAEVNRDVSAAQIKAFAAKMQQITKDTLRLRYDAGLIDQETYDTLTKRYQFYVPLRGLADSEEYGGVGTGRGYDIKGNEMKRRSGRKSMARDVFENIIKDYEHAIIRAEKNKVGQTLLKFVMDNPDQQLWTVNQTVRQPRWQGEQTKWQIDYNGSVVAEFPTKKEADDFINQQNVNNRSQFTATKIVTRQKQVSYANVVDKEADNAMTVKVNGKEYTITFADKLLAAQMKNMNNEEVGSWLQMFSKINRFLSLMWTGLNPVFTAVNAVRDIQVAGYHAYQIGGKKYAWDTVKNAFAAGWGAGQSEFGNNTSDWAKWYEDYQIHGGRAGFHAIGDLADIKSKIANDYALAQSGKLNAVRNYAQNILDTVAKVNAAVENAARVSAYRNYVESQSQALASGQKTIEEVKMEAANIAKNLTVNFNRRGEMTTLLGSMYLFFNPAVQGTARIMQAFKSKPQLKYLAASGVALAFLAAEFNRQFKDDDEEPWWDKDIPDYEKERNLIIMMPDGQRIKFPMPYGYSVFASLGYGLSDLVHGKPVSEVAGKLTMAVMNSFNPIGGSDTLAKQLSPTVFDPVLEDISNTNRFDRAIRPEKRDPFNGVDRPDSSLYFPSTRGTLREGITTFLNEATGGNEYREGWISVSPETAKNYFTYATGGLGTFVSDTADIFTQLAMPAEVVRWERTPFVKTFYGKPTGMGDSQAFRKNSEEAVTALQEAKGLTEANSPKALEVVNANRAMIALGNATKNYRKALSHISEQEAAIKENPDMPPAEKIAKQEELQKQRVSLYKQFNVLFREAKKDGGV